MVTSSTCYNGDKVDHESVGVNRLTSFVHLHVHSEYSLLDSTARIEELVEQAARLGMKALAITDHAVMYGVIPFYKACRKAGIHPIIGCEVNLAPEGLKRPHSGQLNHLLLLAETNEGYRNLLRLVTAAHLQGHHQPYVNKEMLRQYARGLIATSACLSGEIPQAILQGNLTEARRHIETYLQIFGKNNFFLELQDHGMVQQQRVNRHLIALGKEMGVPLVVTNNVHYISREDYEIHDCLLCIGTGKRLDDKNRMRFPSDQFYLKSSEEMRRLFPHLPEAFENTVHISRRCQVEIPLGKRLLPQFPVPEGETAVSYLRKMCKKGVAARYPKVTQEVKDRLAYELSVIEQMGFSDYFLVVWDFVRFARRRGIAVGPGRGSAAGSLVAYVLYITDIDPLSHGLLFERFLNPERVSMPDIDIDFDDERRDEVIRYVAQKYGENHVAQIGTFGTMAPRAAVRDMGRVMGLSYGKVDQAAKLIPGGPGMTLEKAFRQEPGLVDLYREQPAIAQLMNRVRKIEGMPRHVSTHAAGVVISRDPLTDHVPLQEGHDQIPLTQYPMDVLEEIGLLKIDLLGLRNLTIIERTQELIAQLEGKRVDFREVGYEDQITYQMLSRGDTTGVFQLESQGMRRVLRELKPSCFEDIIAVLALYRPGPMEQIPRFIRAKHGKERVVYPHKDLEPILKNTYGIIVYQEQIMQIAAKMAGFSLGEADLLRRAVSKKERTELEKKRSAFIAGCIQNGYTEQVAQEVYDLILRFANYGFNRSHSAAYAVLAYQTAYLKANHPLAYMAALLTTVIGHQSKLAEYIEMCRKMGIKILPPDIHRSEGHFTVEKDGIRFGLAAIKHVGTHAIEAIRQERKRRPFRDLFDFCARVDTRLCNRRVLESLILVGAMDSLGEHRALLLAMLDEALEKGTVQQRNYTDSQLRLFEEEVSGPQYSYQGVTPYSTREILAMERDLLGLYLSGHPLSSFRAVIKERTTHNLDELANCRPSEMVVIAGLITSIKQITTKKGELMAFVRLEDMSQEIEVVVFPRVFQAFRDQLQEERPVLISGRVTHDEQGTKVLADQIEELTEGEKKKKELQKAAYIRISKHHEDKQVLQKLKQLLLDHPGKVPVRLYYEGSQKVLALPVEKYGIHPSEQLQKKIEEVVGKQGFRFGHY